MSFVVLVLILYAVSVALAVALGLAVSGFTTWRGALMFALQSALPLGYLMLVTAFLLLVWAIKNSSTSLYNPIAYSLGGAGAVVTIAGWAERIFSKPPLIQAQFEQGMSDQTEIVKSGNSDLVDMLAENNRLLSALSEDIRALLTARSATAGAIGASDDAED